MLEKEALAVRTVARSLVEAVPVFVRCVGVLPDFQLVLLHNLGCERVNVLVFSDA